MTGLPWNYVGGMKGWMAGQKSSVSTDLLVYGSAAQAGILNRKILRSGAWPPTGYNLPVRTSVLFTEEFVLCFIMNEGRF